MAERRVDRSEPDVEAVVLAAGLSTRFGAPKLVQPLGGGTVIEQTLRGMGACVRRAIVVVGEQDEALRSLLAGRERVVCVSNSDYGPDMFDSVQAGLAATTAGRVFLTPGDIPLVGEPVYRALLASGAHVAIPTYRGRKGHPVLLGRDVIHDVLAAPAGATLRDVIGRWGFEPVPVDDEAILWDIDTQTDYWRIREQYTSRQRSRDDIDQT